MSNKNDEEQQLQAMFKSFDEMVDIYVPDADKIKTIIIKQEKMARKQFIKELSLFILIACIILTALLTILVELPTMFLVIQLMLLVLLPIIVKVDHHHDGEELF